MVSRLRISCKIFTWKYIWQVSSACTFYKLHWTVPTQQNTTYIYRCGLVGANGFAIRENMDGGGRNGVEEMFGNLHAHDM